MPNINDDLLFTYQMQQRRSTDLLGVHEQQCFPTQEDVGETI